MAVIPKDAKVPEDAPTDLLLDKHVDFLAKYGKDKNEYEYVMAEFLRINGVYWALAAMDLMGETAKLDTTDIWSYVQSCHDPSTGGYCPAPRHDPHLLYTLSAVQIACILHTEDTLDFDGIANYVKSLQNADGSFSGDKWGEVDNRFSFCAVACLSLMGKMDVIDVDQAVAFVLSCRNFDGGFGSKPGSESHAGLIYCCLAFLSIVGHLHEVDADHLGWWLAERQLPSGGLNGRPEKLPDVCYSWWVLSSLSMLGRLSWIDGDKMSHFILACQDVETGGISDRPGDLPDPFHTLFGVAGLSMLGEERIKTVNPVYCLPQDVVDRLRLNPQILKM